MGQAASSTSVYQQQQQASGEPCTTSRRMALPQEIDSVFSAAIRYYFRGESLHALRGDDRLQRSEEGADNYGVGGYHRVGR